jgi:DNA polymerase III subunit delta'
MPAQYPWLEPYLQRLAEVIARDRLPHALLVTGQPGMGKSAFSGMLAQLLLCESRDDSAMPCGRCNGCIQFLAKSHPDYFEVAPEEESQVIKVDQVRELGEKLALSSFHAGFKVAVINPAEAMNINAANSLLKTLEEPSDNTVLVLICMRPARLPATIRSRCQQLRIAAPDSVEAQDWLAEQLDGQDPERYLQLAKGAPLEALRLAGAQVIESRRKQFLALVGVLEGKTDPLAVAADWGREENLQPVHWFRDWLMDMVRIHISGQNVGVHSVDLLDGLAKLAARLDGRMLFRQLDNINRLLRSNDGSLNRQLMVEDILLAWAAQQ